MKACKRPHGYKQLRRSIFIRSLMITACAATAVLLFRALSRGHLADLIVEWMMRLFCMEYSQALIIYYELIPNNIEFIIGMTIIIFMLMLFHLLLDSYKRYFDEVVAGIDKIIEDDGSVISLSPELAFVEEKLNHVKQTLQSRQQEARRAEQQKNDLVVYLAHDIKTPLTSVIGYLSLLNDGPELTEGERARYLHIAVDKANRLQRLVDEFFEITRYTLHSVPLCKEEIDLCVMMMQITDELYPKLISSGKKIESKTDESIFIYGDAEKLARVFNNILKNAIAYGDENCTIYISAQEQERGTLIEIENKGRIPDEQIDMIFDKFYRANSARSSETGGAGLGLAIAKSIVELHGGKITAANTNGSTVFSVMLPSAQEGKIKS